jgi:2,4-dienoyl-CoA reductase (NADPH2)
VARADREVWLMQRKTDALGKTLGRTTGWTHR